MKLYQKLGDLLDLRYTIMVHDSVRKARHINSSNMIRKIIILKHAGGLWRYYVSCCQMRLA